MPHHLADAAVTYDPGAGWVAHPSPYPASGAAVWTGRALVMGNEGLIVGSRQPPPVAWDPENDRWFALPATPGPIGAVVSTGDVVVAIGEDGTCKTGLD